MKALIDLTDTDPGGCSPLIYAESLLENNPDSIEDVVVLAHGKGVKFLDEESADVEEIEALMERDVSFKVSRPCVDAQGMDEDELVAGVEMVSSGANELFELQSEGYIVAKIP